MIANQEQNLGVDPVYKGGATLWKLMPEKKAELTLSAQNARPAFVVDNSKHTCSKIFASAVSSEFHGGESDNVTRSLYSITFASFAPAREVRQLPSISAYPNPSRGATRLSLTQVGGDNYKIKVSNTIGKVMRTFELPPVPDNTTVVLDMDMSVYPAGIYFYSLLINDKTVETKRLVLQK
ncbi:T9SS type A sorting domain-containing protein [Pontibacter sp. SGAir0037]|uniref:T9SS type A sorting domain-containing protein n=1 Tax=Pontibacter sp. SGAir0037 TaxID=2571030 RepID=UPI001F112C85|nr:T9SS type A sorting domain-containing protein [Pontibacter sp. SGAir0037]